MRDEVFLALGRLIRKIDQRLKRLNV